MKLTSSLVASVTQCLALVMLVVSRKMLLGLKMSHTHKHTHTQTPPHTQTNTHTHTHTHTAQTPTHSTDTPTHTHSADRIHMQLAALRLQTAGVIMHNDCVTGKQIKTSGNMTQQQRERKRLQIPHQQKEAKRSTGTGVEINTEAKEQEQGLKPDAQTKPQGGHDHAVRPREDTCIVLTSLS